MKKAFILLVLLTQIRVFSQEKNSYNYYWNNEENLKAMVGVSKCYVRENPSTKATLLDSLQIGKEITVIKSTDSDYEINGLNVSWVQIEYQNKLGTICKGFLWKGFIALGYVKKKGLTFLTTLDKFEIRKKDSSDVFFISVKVLNDKNEIVAQKTIQEILGESSYFQNKAIGSLGLTKVKDIYRISFEGEACGIASLYYYFAWNGTNLIQLPGKISGGDPGYYHIEDFIFPKEKGGKPNRIFKVYKEGEALDEEAVNSIYKVEEWQEVYEWNGEKALFIKKSKVKKYRSKE
jgi:hypothetical protein